MRLRYKLFLCGLVAALVVTGAVLLAAYGVLRHLSIAVEDASLTRFDLLTSPVTSLAYKLSLTLVVHNPNWVISINNMEQLFAAYSFGGQQFDLVPVPVSDEDDKLQARKTRVYRLVTGWDSDDYVILGDAAVPEYRKQNATGTFEVELKLDGEFSYATRHTKCKLEATCPLKLQLQPASSPWSASGSIVFKKVKCKLAKHGMYC